MVFDVEIFLGILGNHFGKLAKNGGKMPVGESLLVGFPLVIEFWPDPLFSG